MRVKANLDIHNRFDFHVEDLSTGEKQVYTAHNIILNQLWSRMIPGNAYFDGSSHIHWGRGTGTLDPVRTTLFDRISSKAGASLATSYSVPTCWAQRRVVLNPEDSVGEIITEVGIGYTGTATHMVTHAMLADAEGNPLSITKTDVMIVTIYATVFCEVGAEDSMFGGKIKWGSLGNVNAVQHAMGQVSATGSAQYLPDLMPGKRSIHMGATGTALAFGAYGSGGAVSSDVPNKRRVFDNQRWAAAVSNGHVAALGCNLGFGVELPLAGTWGGQQRNDVVLGTGNGTNRVFVLPSRNVDKASVTVKVEGLATTAFTPQTYFVDSWVQGITLANNGYNDGGVFYKTHWFPVGAGNTDCYNITQYYDSTSLVTTLVAQFVENGGAPTANIIDTFSIGGWITSIASSGDYLFISRSNTFRWYKMTFGPAPNRHISLTLLANPVGLPANTAYVAAKEGFMAVGGGSEFKWYEIDTATDELVEMNAPVDMPLTNVISMEWGAGGYLLVGSDSGTHPRLKAYKRGVDGLLDPILNTITPPNIAENASGMVWSTDSKLVAFPSGSSFKVWVRNGDAFTEGGITVAGTMSYTTGGLNFLEADDRGSVLVYARRQSPVYYGQYFLNETGQPEGVEQYVMSAGSDTLRHHSVSRNAATCGATYTSPQTRWRVANVTRVVLDVAPALDEVVTASFLINGMHKTVDWLVDIATTLQYGEPVV